MDSDVPKRKGRKRSTAGKGKFPANKKRRLDSNRKHSIGQSGSDPLNLEAWSDDNPCPGVDVPSPNHHLGDQPLAPLPEQLHNDPLNLEGKIENFDSIVSKLNQQNVLPLAGGNRKRTFSISGKRKRHSRTKSQSESSSTESSAAAAAATPSFNPKAAVFRYGNYTQYYGYRNSDSYCDDPRLKLLKEEWFRGKDCLDIGCNTGQITLTVAQRYGPRRITGVDIDSKLVRMAWKNLHRHSVPVAMPSGQPFPKSLMMHRLPLGCVMSSQGEERRGGEFPKNIDYKQVNYVPSTEEELLSVQSQYDVILCLSITKWIHLNWGDDGLKRMFRKMYRHLRPGGLLILEPQPWSSYAKRKKLTATIYSNYQNIKFLPHEFTSYLMSPAVGFSKHSYLGTSENKSPGFQRCIHLYTKPTDTMSDVSQQTPPSKDQTPPSKDQTPPSKDQTPPTKDQTPPTKNQTPPTSNQSDVV